MRKRWIAVIASTLLCGATAADAEVYKWTDEDGVTHYTEQPPPDRGEASVLDPQVGAPSSQGPEQQGNEQQGTEQTAEPDDAAGEGEDTQSVEAFCKELRQNIETLKGDGPVKVRTGEDTLKTLDGEERQARLERAQSQLESQCS